MSPRKAPPIPAAFAEAREEHRTEPVVRERYRVSGRHSVLGVAPGGLVDVDITGKQLSLLLATGNLERVTEEVVQQEDPAAEETGPEPDNR